MKKGIDKCIDRMYNNRAKCVYEILSRKLCSDIKSKVANILQKGRKMATVRAKKKHLKKSFKKI